MDAVPAEPGSRRVWPVWLILALLVVILFVPLAIRPIDGDPALYSYIGWRVSEGDRLYLDVWDVKPPLFPLIYAAGFKVFGRQEWVGPLLEMLAIWLAAVGTFCLAKRLAPSPLAGANGEGVRKDRSSGASSLAGWIGAISLLAGLWGLSAAGMGMQAEVFALPFILWAMVWAYTSPLRDDVCAGRGQGVGSSFWPALASGVLIACAALIKTPFILFAVPWFLAAGFSGTVLPFLIGLIAPIGLAGGYLAMIGAFDEARYTLLEFGPAFAGAHKLPFDASIKSAGQMAGALWPVPVIAGIGALALLIDRRLGPLLAGFVAALVVVFWQSSYWIYHWSVAETFALVGAAVVISGWIGRRWPSSHPTGIRHRSSSASSPPPAPSPSGDGEGLPDADDRQSGSRLQTPTSKFLRAAAGLALLILLLTPLQGFWLEQAGLAWKRLSGQMDEKTYADRFPSAYGWPPLSQKTVRALAAEVRAKTRPGDTIWTPMAPPTVAFLAGRREAVRFAYSDGLFVDADRRSQWRDEYMAAIEREKPKLVVLVRDMRGSDKQQLIGQIRGAADVLAQDYEIAEIFQADGAQGPAIELLRREQ